MKYILYVLVLVLGVLVFGYFNSKISYKHEVEIMRTHLEINPSMELEKKIDSKEKRIKKSIKTFEIFIILTILLILIILFYRQRQYNGVK